MKKFLLIYKKIAIALVMGTGFMYAITNINVSCSAWCYQPKPPKSLEAYKNLKMNNIVHALALAPYKAAVLPLSKKLSGAAEKIYSELSKHFMIDYDDAGSIGKRYRREDEIGTPICITVDFQTTGDDATEGDGCVTVRDRDTMQQERIKIEDLKEYIEKKIEF